MAVESLDSSRVVDYGSRRAIHDGIRAFREAREMASRSVRRDIGDSGDANFDPTFFSTARRRRKACVRAPPEKCGSGAFTKTD